MRSVSKYMLAAGAISLIGLMPASAATCTSTSTECSALLNIISASNIGSGTQGTVYLTEKTANQVEVEVSLAPGVELINSGGPHNPFVYNLSSALAGVTVAIESTSNSSPASFFTPGGTTDTPYGTFTNGIGYNGHNGGPPHGNPGPLFFTVTDTNGINLTDFVKNGSLGYFFAADLYGTGGHTGAVAADGLTCVTGCGTTTGGGSVVPLPAAWPLFASGLGLVGLFGRRRKQKNATAA